MEDRDGWYDPTGPGQRDQMNSPTASNDPGESEGNGVLTLVCFKCGTEYFFADEPPPPELSCEKCGNTVFRSFYSGSSSEALQDFEDSTVRDLDADDAEGDTFPGDVLDLDRL